MLKFILICYRRMQHKFRTFIKQNSSSRPATNFPTTEHSIRNTSAILQWWIFFKDVLFTLIASHVMLILYHNLCTYTEFVHCFKQPEQYLIYKHDIVHFGLYFCNELLCGWTNGSLYRHNDINRQMPTHCKTGALFSKHSF